MNFYEYMDHTGHKVKTTFWEDFTIADQFGIEAIQDTYNRAFSEWKNNCEYLTELVIVLNLKCWQFYHISETDPDHDLRWRARKKSELYVDLYETASEWAENNLTGEDLEYFYKQTD